MEAVDEEAERIEREVLAERHRRREPAVGSSRSAPDLVVDEAEQSAVDEMYREPGTPPAPAAGHCLAENRNIGVVAPKRTAVERLLKRPNRRRRDARRGGPRPTA